MAFFVSNDELETLRSKAARYDDATKVEKRFRKQLNRERQQYDERIEDLNDEHEVALHKLQRQVDKADSVRETEIADLKAEHKNTLSDLKRDHEAQVEKLTDQINQLEGKIEVLQGRVATEAQLTKRELDIEDKEDELERAAEFLSNREKDFNKKVKEFDARVNDENEAQYKKGYTDGVSDTLREGQALAETGNERTFKLAEKALDRETTVISTVQAPTKSK